MTKDNFCGAIDEIKMWRDKEDTTTKRSVGRAKRKNHKNVAKGGSKAATSWTTGMFLNITLGLALLAALLLLVLTLTCLQRDPLGGGRDASLWWKLDPTNPLFNPDDG